MHEKNDLRISLKFSEKDRDQVEIANLLKQKGRKKSAFITEAVIFYLQNKEEELPEKTTIRCIVREILNEIGYTSEELPNEISQTTKKSKSNNHSSGQDKDFEDSYFSSEKKVDNNASSDLVSSIPDNDLQELLGSLDLFGGW